MSLLIYFETNWIVGAVLGQDPLVDQLLSPSQEDLRLAIPSACVMEAISAFDWKRIERNRLKDELDRQLAQVQRSRQIPAAQQLAAQLIQAKLTNDKLLNDLFCRLDDLLVRVVKRAEMVPLLPEAVEFMLRLQRETELDRDDALILACILSHSKNQPLLQRAFLTGNFRDFAVEPVRIILEQNSIQLFSSTERLLQWARSDRRSF